LQQQILAPNNSRLVSATETQTTELFATHHAFHSAIVHVVQHTMDLKRQLEEVNTLNAQKKLQLLHYVCLLVVCFLSKRDSCLYAVGDVLFRHGANIFENAIRSAHNDYLLD